MRNLLLFLRRFLPELALLLSAFVSLNLLNSSSGKHNSALTDALGSTASSVFQVKSSVSNYFSLSENNERLQAENQLLRNRLAEKSSMILAPEVRVDSTQLLRYQACDIINSTVHKDNNYFTINQGEKQGVKSGLAVVSDRGVVGVVTHAGNNYSIVLPLVNQRFTTSAEHKKTGSFGFLNWKGIDPKVVNLSDVANHINMAIGDTIISRGSNIYPRGIPIGSVLSVKNLPGEPYLDIQLELFEDFGSLRHVFWVDKILVAEQDSLEQIQEAL
jgi:rod shape-determining protein MreC